MPGPFLPAHVVLKHLSKGAYPELFENEKQMYCRLQRLQGGVVPSYFGKALYGGRTAIVMSFVEGVASNKQDPPRFSMKDFQHQLEVVSAGLRRCGVVRDDPKLGT